jgi:tRNA threonylcarbamoyladenosine biosynthesis protein TsaB
MLLLSVDTSGKHGSIALAQCDGAVCNAIEIVSLVGGTFSAQLIPQIAALLAKHSFSKHDITGFVVATGPGSFTGLRVGLAAIKALADVLAKPIAAVSLLEAVASASSLTGRVLALMDAGRGEVFAGAYEIPMHDGEIHALGEKLIKIDDVSSASGQHIVTADENLAQLLQTKGVEAELIERPRTDTLARLGWRKIQVGDTVSPEHLEANYIRQSDAEIFSRPSGQP